MGRWEKSHGTSHLNPTWYEAVYRLPGRGSVVGADETLAVHLPTLAPPIDCRAVVHPAQLAVQPDGVPVLDQGQHDERRGPGPGRGDGRGDEPRRDAAAARVRVHEQAAEDQ